MPEPLIRPEQRPTKPAPAGNPLIAHPDNISAGSWSRITVAWVRAGQPRPYADSIYEADLCIEGGSRSTLPGYDLPFGTKRSVEAVKEIAQVLVRPFRTDDYPNRWGRLESIECIAQGDGYSTWRVKVVEPYTD